MTATTPQNLDLLAELTSSFSTPISPTPPSTTEGEPDPNLSASLRKKLLKEQRKREKDERKANAPKESATPTEKGGLPTPGGPDSRFKVRKWIEVEGEERHERDISLFSWNMLAQALVRRELFPNSDFLKVKDRIPTLMQEVLYYNPDIALLQEVDRLSDHLPSLTKTYSYTSFIGYPNKSHGLLIAYKTALFEKIGERGIRLDELAIVDVTPSSSDPPTPSTLPSTPSPTSTTEVDEFNEVPLPPPPPRNTIGLSRSTRNVALTVALKFKNRPGGIIVATTHLFWHPQHVYERTRQVGVLVREMNKFRNGEGEWNDWPLILAGDLNTQPRESTYRLLLGLPLTSSQEADITRSTLIHESVDKLYDANFVSSPPNPLADADGIRGGNLSQHPDRVIKNAREGTEEDGLASLEDLKGMFKLEGEVRSAYGEVGGRLKEDGGRDRCYVDRPEGVQSASGWKIKEDEKVVEERKKGEWGDRVRRGDFEPKYTNFTPLWRCTLDYIFVLPPPTSSETTTKPKFIALLQPHADEEMEPGMPKLGVEPSDHAAVAAVLRLD